MRTRLYRWLAPLAWMGLIFFLSAQPDLPHVPGPWLDTLLKKGAHALVYAILAYLFLWALRGEGPATTRLRWISLILAILYGISDELHQSFVPGRNPSLVDLLIDSTGAALSVAVSKIGPAADLGDLNKACDNLWP